MLYNAPETFVDDYYSNAIDIWSFGCVVFEMIKLERLFKNTSKISEFDVNIELNAKNFDSFFFTILKKYNLYSWLISYLYVLII